MRRMLPYPLLFAALILFWLLLNGFTRGQTIIGVLVAFFACQTMTALEPQKNRIRSLPTILKLFGTVSLDILLSNIAVVRIILSGRKRARRAGFVVIPLELENRTALAALACMITATPGTAWVDHHAARRELTIHVLDLTEAQEWRDLIKSKYEKPLIEIFGAEDVMPEEKSA